MYHFDFMDSILYRGYGMGYVRRHGMDFWLVHQYTSDALRSEIREQLLEVGRAYYRGQISLDVVERCLPEIFDDFKIFSKACDCYKMGIISKSDLLEVKERYLLEAGIKMYEYRLLCDILCARLRFFAGFGRLLNDND